MLVSVAFDLVVLMLYYDCFIALLFLWVSGYKFGVMVGVYL